MTTPSTSLVREGLGTACNSTSPVWFTLANGRVEELYYPDLSTPRGRLELAILNDAGECLYESEGMIRLMERPDTDVPLFRQVNSDPMGNYRLSKLAFTDSNTACFLLHVRLEALHGLPTDYHIKVKWETFGANDSPSTLTIHPQGEGTWISNQTQNGVAILASSSSLITDEQPTTNSSTQWVGRVQIPDDGGFRLIVGFGNNIEEASDQIRTTLRQSWTDILSQYRSEWQTYCKRLNNIDGWAPPLYYSSLMLLKTLEDKENPGAIAPSLTLPIRYTAESSYRFATAFWSAGDHRSPKTILRFLKRWQNADGSFPSYIPANKSEDIGTPSPKQTAYALLLIWQLEAIRSFHSTVVPAVMYLLQHGDPDGIQAADVPLHLAALRCAADLAQTVGEEEHAQLWSLAMDQWKEKSLPPSEKEEGWAAWARLGMLPATHPSLLKAAMAYDNKRRQMTPYGALWTTSANSADTPTRLSVRSAGERGHYELQCDRDPSAFLTALEQIGGEEGILSAFLTPQGEKIGATPDPLTHAEYIRLLVSQSWGKPCDLPLPASMEDTDTDLPI
ncbi:Glucoamylase (glucan-1,4-alpha-glucosidase), GH15 family [Marininema mesophilum]|uniref:Glucoamylase (Glucan-1,4-alpha-glucosidase), GH15 family n=1 Tax=Marininema mesophilum TaxID=1048340 RepID=A0A1H3AKC4_9BACL|nr:hypothetical protein [Marininema mesophilum]SDX30055.1 Glucoamylase (glucan-1,4-alpha-glucosidase), GH15 family [Marininema mesophilum]